MLPPHQPARRKKIGAAKPVKPAAGKAAPKSAAAPAKAEPAKPALRVLARKTQPSPVAAARTRRIGC